MLSSTIYNGIEARTYLAAFAKIVYILDPMIMQFLGQLWDGRERSIARESDVAGDHFRQCITPFEHYKQMLAPAYQRYLRRGVEVDYKFA
ncbi:hypothetical protein CSC76_18590 [Pseudoxanthomonas mexicana]|nr:hypothetical protein CSC76_18590 [Pseudoxanthomonas mexicana]